jgi:hypothetical protein
MKRMFLVTFNGTPETRDLLAQFLDSHDQILDWHSSMVNSVFIITDLSVVEVRELLKEAPIRRYIVVEIAPEDFNRTVSGWLPRATWDFVKRRQAAT